MPKRKALDDRGRAMFATMIAQYGWEAIEHEAKRLGITAMAKRTRLRRRVEEIITAIEIESREALAQLGLPPDLNIAAIDGRVRFVGRGQLLAGGAPVPLSDEQQWRYRDLVYGYASANIGAEVFLLTT